MLKFLVKEPDPKELVRKWQSDLRTQQRTLDRQIRDIQFEEKKIQKSVKEAAKRGDMGSAKHLAKEIVQSRKAVGRLYTNKAHLIGLGTSLTEQMAMIKVAGAMGKSTEVMKTVSNLMKVPDMQKTMMEMGKEMMKAGLIDEMLNDALDSALDTEDMEEETEEQIEQVLAEIAGDTKAAMPTAKTKVPAQRQKVQVEEEEEEDEMAQMQARLDAVRT